MLGTIVKFPFVQCEKCSVSNTFHFISISVCEPKCSSLVFGLLLSEFRGVMEDFVRVRVMHAERIFLPRVAHVARILVAKMRLTHVNSPFYSPASRRQRRQSQHCYRSQGGWLDEVETLEPVRFKTFHGSKRSIANCV